MQQAQGHYSASLTLGGLPPELLSKILSFLDARYLSLASAVCKLWQQHANDDVLWRALCETRWASLRHLPTHPVELHPRVNFSDSKLVATLSIKEIKSVLARRYVRVPSRGAVEKDDLVALLRESRPIHSPRGQWTGKWFVFSFVEATRGRSIDLCFFLADE